MEPVLLEMEEILEIHRDQIERYGGSLGVRDQGLLESALGAPQASYGGEYLHIDLHEMAAAYLCSIVNNHPFIDGNKRTGAAATVVFLLMNGFDLEAGEDEFESLVLSVACGEIDKASAADFIRARTRQRPAR